MRVKRNLGWQVVAVLLLAAALSGCQSVAAGGPTAAGTVEVGIGAGR